MRKLLVRVVWYLSYLNACIWIDRARIIWYLDEYDKMKNPPTETEE